MLHCCGSVVEANDVATADRFAAAYGDAASMSHIARWTAYAVTGQFIDAMDRIGIAAIDVEMAALNDIGLDEHRAAVQAVLRTDHAQTADSAPRASTSSATASSAIPVTSDAASYRVRAGDTLGNIAVRYGTTASSLASTNRLSRPDLIEVGQVLIVPR
jgi:hypothetical protein